MIRLNLARRPNGFPVGTAQKDPNAINYHYRAFPGLLLPGIYCVTDRSLAPDDSYPHRHQPARHADPFGYPFGAYPHLHPARHSYRHLHGFSQPKLDAEHDLHPLHTADPNAYRYPDSHSYRDAHLYRHPHLHLNPDPYLYANPHPHPGPSVRDCHQYRDIDSWDTLRKLTCYV